MLGPAGIVGREGIGGGSTGDAPLDGPVDSIVIGGGDGHIVEEQPAALVGGVQIGGNAVLSRRRLGSIGRRGLCPQGVEGVVAADENGCPALHPGSPVQGGKPAVKAVAAPGGNGKLSIEAVLRHGQCPGADRAAVGIQGDDIQKRFPLGVQSLIRRQVRRCVGVDPQARRVGVPAQEAVSRTGGHRKLSVSPAVCDALAGNRARCATAVGVKGDGKHPGGAQNSRRCRIAAVRRDPVHNAALNDGRLLFRQHTVRDMPLKDGGFRGQDSGKARRKQGSRQQCAENTFLHEISSQ